MVPLFLSEPNWDDEDGDNEAASQIVSLLSKLGSVIWSLMVSGGRSEARLWLCNAVSRLSSISPHHKRDIFMKMLTSKPTRKGLAPQLLRLVFEKRPRKVGSILANKSYLLEKFFQGKLGFYICDLSLLFDGLFNIFCVCVFLFALLFSLKANFLPVSISLSSMF